MSNVKALEAIIESATRTRADHVAALTLLSGKLADAKTRLANATSDRDAYEIDNDDHEDAFCESIDSSYESLFGMSPSYIMRKMDPCMYSQGLNDYVDGLDKADQAEYQELDEIVDDVNTEIDDIENDIHDTQVEIDDIDEEIEQAKAEINVLQALQA